MSPRLHRATVGAGAPLIMLHGWGFDGSAWAPTADRLAGSRQVVLPDLPGHGHSPLVDDGDALIDALAALVDVAGGVDWVGWSLGGLLALRLALQRPEVVRRLLIVAMGPQFIATDDWPYGVEGAVLRAFQADLRRDRGATVQRFLALQVDGGERASQTLRALRRHLREQPVASDLGLLWGLRQLGATDLRNRLPGLLSPCRFILGGQDRLVPVAMAAELRRLAPALDVRVLDAAAHVPHWSHPAAFDELLLEFLD